MKIPRSFSFVVGFLVAVAGLHAQGTAPFTFHDKPWRGLPTGPAKTEDKVRDGGAPFTLRWDAGKPGTNNIDFRFTSRDFSGYDTLSFWVYAEKATFATIQVLFISPTTMGEADVYEADFSVDTEGKWAKYTLALDSFRKSRNPAGWDQITGIHFTTNRHGNAPVEGTVLFFSDMQLELSK
ncbi:MAG: hypothetical protein H7067_02340 [Burkholderiales bacterium]|nr:hypothetical protein [Opitutaceae bacterium]